MKQQLLIVVFSLTLMPDSVYSARILGLFATPARSHSLVFETLLNALASRGHDVTFASAVAPQLQPPSNISGGSFTPVYLEGLKVLASNMPNIVGPDRRPLMEALILWNLAPTMCEVLLASPELQPLFKDKTIKFDLIIVEVFFFDCMIPFARYFKAPFIAFTSFWPPPWANVMLGNPEIPTVSPSIFLPYGDTMTFFERTHNAIHTAVLLVLRRWLYLPRQDAVARRFFGEDTPSIAQLETEAALLLSNSHPAVIFPHANVPAVIEVGGLHIQPAKKLPEELEAYLNESRDGVVLFSLGSMINDYNLPPERVSLLVTAMAALPYNVLWRWDTRDVPGLPSNVRVEKWMPQRDILAHPNVRVLVTHGGLLSALEASVEGVPRLVMPFFGDQQMNALRAVQNGVALSLDFYHARPEHLISAVKQLSTDPSYRNAAKRLAKIFLDQPETPLERAVFWTEYVLRHDGAPHLRSAATHLAWYQLYLLDMTAVLLLLFVIIVIALRTLFRFLFRKRKSTENVQKDKDQ